MFSNPAGSALSSISRLLTELNSSGEMYALRWMNQKSESFFIGRLHPKLLSDKVRLKVTSAVLPHIALRILCPVSNFYLENKYCVQ